MEKKGKPRAHKIVAYNKSREISYDNLYAAASGLGVSRSCIYRRTQDGYWLESTKFNGERFRVKYAELDPTGV